jgi:hypothetical protein
MKAAAKFTPVLPYESVLIFVTGLSSSLNLISLPSGYLPTDPQQIISTFNFNFHLT